MSSIGFHTTKLQHDNIQNDKHKSSVHPKEIIVTLVIQTSFVLDSKLLCRLTKCFLVCECNYCADAKSNYFADAKTFFFHCTTNLQHG